MEGSFERYLVTLQSSRSIYVSSTRWSSMYVRNLIAMNCTPHPEISEDIFIISCWFTINLQVYKKFFPDIAVGYEDPRVNVCIGDGKYIYIYML